jgi:Right handed beta helix region
MKRRTFLKQAGLGVTGLSLSALPLSGFAESSQMSVEKATTFYVATNGHDSNPGTLDRPFATLARAQQAVRQAKRNVRAGINVFVRKGTYYLNETLMFGPEDSGTASAPIVYMPFEEEIVTLSGGLRLNCDWRPYQDGIFVTEVSKSVSFASFDQLFVNGKRQILARYPNYDDSEPGKSGYLTAAGAIPDSMQDPNPPPDADMTFGGGPSRGVLFDPTSFSPRKWAKPQEAVIHIFQAAYWGNLEWRLRSLDRTQNAIWFGEGGFQIGAKWDRHPEIINQHSRYFIDNVFEELDAPHEWYLDREGALLYYMPDQETDLRSANIEIPQLETVIRFSGTQQHPVEYVMVSGFRFAHTKATYLDSYEVPSLSDWSIHRGGTVFFAAAKNCAIKDCWFDAVGGNAVFLSNFNRDDEISGCAFTETGDSAICFVGSWNSTNGTVKNFPYECIASNNLIHDCGVFGKQIAGVYISRAKRITASHNLIYNMPRAGICIGDGTWGGHVIEYNNMHDTVRETSDHGPFNAWGRDRAWSLAQSHGHPYTAERSIDAWDVLVDAMEPVIVRNNIFNEKSGWGLDLDDGASNYDIYNNISIGGVSMKLREGAYRKVHNNIWYRARVAPCFHVGNDYNHDQYFNNITVMDPGNAPAGFPWWPAMSYSVIAPPVRGPWFEEIDRNCMYTINGEFRAVVDELRAEDGKRDPKQYNFSEWQKLGFDQHSIIADPLFADPQNLDFRVRPESPALKVGFVNFDMGKWGVTSSFPKKWKNVG